MQHGKIRVSNGPIFITVYNISCTCRRVSSLKNTYPSENRSSWISQNDRTLPQRDENTLQQYQENGTVCIHGREKNNQLQSSQQRTSLGGLPQKIGVVLDVHCVFDPDEIDIAQESKQICPDRLLCVPL